ncbi:Multidrug resistance protein CDR1 [Pichia kudriavzevii]|uniref:Multidrug resistance protein CDR1 n=1 Tax=Pichia kudriavzevii TaxID=4909 RepID=A0A1V2LJ21_PICKU|nr:Multidrug resistance protein CDR1 [Pichia kudriavzevii]
MSLDHIDVDDEMGEYQGFTPQVEGSIKELSREFSENEPNRELIRKMTTSYVPDVDGINPFETEDPRLDPNSDEFSSKYWVNNLKRLVENNPDFYKPTTLGFAAKNLVARGVSSDADYQSNFLNYPFKICRDLYMDTIRKNDKSRYFEILKSMDVLIKPGTLTVVLGRPGAGCSTFLKTVAAQTYGFKVDKNSVISYDGLTPNDIVKHYRGEVMFSAETDNHFPHLTVGQTLEFAALMRTPQNRFPGSSRRSYAKLIAEVYMATYGLSHTINTKVGDNYIRGVSGGERKRVSIAEASICGASIECWDNATRGLDAATALEFVRALKTQAHVLNGTPLIAIYQCSQDAYDLFDNVLLLYEGYQIYFGSAVNAKKYFETMGYECPERQTTADFLTSITSSAERVPKKGFENKVPRTPLEFATYWRNSDEYTTLVGDIDEYLKTSVGSIFKTLAESMPPAAVLLTAMVIYTGFALPIPSMLGWSRWINYIDPVAYAFEALLTNEFSGLRFACSDYIPGYPNLDLQYQVCSVVSALPGYDYINGTDYMEQNYQYSSSHRWRNFGIIVGFVVFFLGVYIGLVEINKGAMQKGEIILFQQSKLRKLRKQGSKLSGSNDIEAATSIEKRESTSEDSVSGEADVSDLDVGTDIFHWRDVCYEIQIKSETRRILNHVDGWVKPGTLTALMGASGAGKTTLLDVLANRVTMGIVSGSMFVNGRLRDQSFQRSTGYVQQQDLHLETSTVREALRFSAYLRQSRDISKEEKDRYIESVIGILEMQSYADAVVGVAGEGLNVEQRKRLTIGVELAAKPKLLLFLDEPTSGLDSQTAWSICQLMRKLADHGQAILCTIHQPSAILLKEFDRLLFLAKGGRTVYFGDLGQNCQTLINYFESHGAEKCPPEANPAEWMLSVIGAAPGSHAKQDYFQVWMTSREREAVVSELEEMEKELLKKEVDTSPEKKRSFASSYATQYNRYFTTGITKPNVICVYAFGYGEYIDSTDATIVHETKVSL